MRRLTAKRRLLLTIAVAVLVLGVAASLFWSPARPEPHEAKADPPWVRVFDHNHEPIWSVYEPGAVDDTVTLAPIGPTAKTSLVVGEASGEGEAMVRAYEGTDLLLWKNRTYEEYPAPLQKAEGTRRMRVSHLVARDFFGNGSHDVLAISNDNGHSPCKVSILDGATGKAKRKYWHDGNLQRVVPFEPATGKGLRVLVWGCCNDPGVRKTNNGNDHCYSLVCLDPQTMEEDTPVQVAPIGRGAELWYGVVRPGTAMIERVTLRRRSAQEVKNASPAVFEVEIRDLTLLYVDEHGQIVGRSPRPDRVAAANVRIELVR